MPGRKTTVVRASGRYTEMDNTVHESKLTPALNAIERAFEVKAIVGVLTVPSGAATDWRIISVPSKLHQRIEDFIRGWNARGDAENAEASERAARSRTE